jgi:hypothetical protein
MATKTTLSEPQEGRLTSWQWKGRLKAGRSWQSRGRYQPMAAWLSTINLKAKKITLKQMAKGGKVRKDSMRVLGKRACARGRKRGQC